MVLLLPYHLSATGSPAQRLPDFQQNTLPILPPLMIPKPQLLDSYGGEKLCPSFVTLELLRRAVLKTVQFH